MTLFRRVPHCGPNAAYTAHLWSLNSSLTWLCLLLNALWTQSLIHQAKGGSNSEMKSQQCQHFLYFQSSHSAQRSKSLQLTSSRRSQLMHDKQMLPDVPCFFPLCSWISSLSHILPVFLFFKERVSLWVPLKGCEEEAFFLRVALWKMTRGNVFILKTLLLR